MKKIDALILLLSFMMIPTSASAASIFISEIMYDLQGSDSKHEWVEVSNSGNTEIDLSSFRLYENDTNHKLNVIQGSGTLEAGGVAVIADDAATFLTDWPGFSGNLFDSSFSLNNAGETLIVRDADLTDLDSVSYLSDWGGAGDGNSLQLISGSWIAGGPTPGEIHSTAPESVAPEEEDSITTTEGGSPTGGSTQTPARPTLVADAGGDRTVIVGADATFIGRAFGNGVELEGVEFIWNFGNGDASRGKSIRYHYTYPGTYRVLLTVASGKNTATEKVSVTAIPAEVAVTEITSAYTEVTNRASQELDLSGWFLFDGVSYFRFPEGTLLLPETPVRITAAVSGISRGNVVLLYPNGNVVEQSEEHNPPPVQATSAVPPAKSEKVIATAVRANSPAQEGQEKNMQVAAAAEATDKNTLSNNMLLWLLAVLGVVGVGVFGFFSFRPMPSEADPSLLASDEADTYELIEEEESATK